MKTFLEKREWKKNYYKYLQDRSLEMVQKLSGNIWTDYNIHDPGVTILDILNYALYDLHYIYDFSLDSYLSDGSENNQLFSKVGLLPVQEIFSPSIVTTRDYETLIKNKIPEVADCRVDIGKTSEYIIQATVKEGYDQQKVKLAIEKLYHANRNLCENLGKVDIGNFDPKRKEEIIDDCPEYGGLPLYMKSDTKKWTEYSSIQNDFPDCYGINERGTPSGATPEQKVQILQLKAYLLIFDFLLKNSISQAAQIYDLLELSGKIPENILSLINIRDIQSLVDEERMNKNKVCDETFLHHQKSSYLDVLDTIYGENTDTVFPRSEIEISDSNKKRAILIRLFPSLNKNRFKSFNLLDHRSVPGIRKLISALLGYNVGRDIPLINLFSRYNLQLLSDHAFFHKYRDLLNIEFIFDDIYNDWLDNEIEKIPKIKMAFDERKLYLLKRHLNIFRHNIIFESFLYYGADPGHYLMVQLPDRNGYLLIFHHPDRKIWLNLGFFFEKNVLIETTNHLWEFLKVLNQKSQSFYLIEHILLNENPYDLSVIIPRWTEQYHEKGDYEKILSERLPAHLNLYFHWLGSDDVYSFEKLYFVWRKALATGDTLLVAHYAERIRRFLHPKL